MTQQILKPGIKAPDFKLPVAENKFVSLSDYLGKNVILFFYPSDWSPVCSDQAAVYNEVLEEFERLNAQIIGISVDNFWSHLAFSESKKLKFPLLSDFEPKGEVAKLYGVYDQIKGKSKRALFVIDKQGLITWSYLSQDGSNPGADGILDALENLNH